MPARPLVLTLAAFTAAASLITSCVGTTSADIRVVEAPATSKLPGPVPTTVASTVKLTPTTQKTGGDCQRSLSIESKVGQLIMVLTNDPTKVATYAGDGRIGGVGLVDNQAKGIDTKIAAVKAAAKIPLMVASDEEGGTVQRLRGVLGPLPSARDSAKSMTPGQVEAMWTTYAQSMAGLGLNVDFAPVLDVGYGVAIVSRSFSDDVEKANTYGAAAIAGINAGGIIPVVKHWPGIGSSSVDPHGGLATVGNLASLKAKDFVPFETAIKAGVRGVMVTHANIPDVTNGVPATVSPAAMKILREDQKFTGVIFTDSLDMGAITTRYTQAEAAELAIVAGADVVEVQGNANVESAFARLVDAVKSGRISEDRLDQSVERIFAFKKVTGPCEAASAVATTAPPSGASAGSTASGQTTTTVTRRDPAAGAQEVTTTATTTTTTAP